MIITKVSYLIAKVTFTKEAYDDKTHFFEICKQNYGVFIHKMHIDLKIKRNIDKVYHLMSREEYTIGPKRILKLKS